MLFQKFDVALLPSIRKVMLECVKTNSPLPEEISDIFTLEIVEEDGVKKGIVDFVED
jgi:hypothetical protein